MTRHFDSLGEMAVHLVARYELMKVTLEAGLERCAQKVEKTAKSEFGSYQPAVGPFQAWEPLSFNTLEGWGPFPGKVELGYAPPDNPLVREGDLRAAVTHETHDFEAVVGVREGREGDIMTWHEFGTSRMPARPVLGPAAYRNRQAIQQILGAAAVTGIVGQDQIHELLGYNFKTGPSG
jgi:phage gpG-like protein